MSLLDTISRTVKGLLNDAAESVQDPSRDARQIVRELDGSIGTAENSLIEIEAQVSTQQSKRDREGRQIRGRRQARAAGQQ
jgi:phage shock protein A